MKIVSWNVNGIRSLYRKDEHWLDKINADIVSLQEIKTQQEQQLSFVSLNPPDYHSYFNPAVKKGYAGTAVYTKQKALTVKQKIGLKRFDFEGRILQLEFPDFVLINLYLPHGCRDKSNLSYKLEVYRQLLKHLAEIPAKGWSTSGRKNQNIILTGDFNIAHQEIDLARPKQNTNNTMFTPEERKQINNLLELGFVDTFRKFQKRGEHYTWWPYLANARQRNLGWRIDYIFVSKALAPKVKDAFILTAVMGSDHCPVGIDVTL